jgi:ferredoxin
MSHVITESCIGCQVCAIKCPTEAITGGKKELHVIDPGLCIDCSVCGKYCPVECIYDDDGSMVNKYKPKEMPKAVVDIDACTGCDYCVTVCPFDCIELVDAPEQEAMGLPQWTAIVHEKDCVGCRLCEQVCIKEAIWVPEFIGGNRIQKKYWPGQGYHATT